MQNFEPENRRGWWPTLYGILLFIIPLIYLLSPALFSVRPVFIGYERGELWAHLWGYWWYYDSIIKNGVIPLETDLIYYPYGVRFLLADPMNALLMIPLNLLFPLTTAYNILVVYHFILAFFSSFFFFRYLTGNILAAWTGATIFGFSSYFLSCIFNGLTETISIGYIPLALLFFLKNMKEDKWWFILLSGIGLFLISVNCWYYLYAFLIFWVVFHLINLSLNRVTTISTLPKVKVLIRGGISLIIALSLILPLAIVQWSDINAFPLRKKEGRTIPEPGYNPLWRVNSKSADLLNFFLPGSYEKIMNGDGDGNVLFYSSYLGIFPMLLFISGSILFFRKILPWLITSIVFLILSLGPYLSIGGHPILSPPMPGYFLIKYLPFYSFMMNHYHRFSLFVLLSIASGSVLFIHEFMQKSKMIGIIFALLSPIIFLTESFFFSPVPHPLPVADSTVSSAYSFLKGLDERFAVTTLPFDGKLYIYQKNRYLQTIHEKPIDDGPYNWKGLKENPFISLFSGIDDWEFFPAEDVLKKEPQLIESAIDDMINLGFRYIILETEWLMKEKRDKVRSFLTSLFGTPRKFDRGVELYEIRSIRVQGQGRKK